MTNSINLFGPLNSTGFGTHFFNWAKGVIYHLTQKGINVAVVPRGQLSRPELSMEHLAGMDAALIDAINQQATMSFDVPGICLWHGHDMSQFCGKPRVGYTVWETSELSPREKHHLQQLDFIAVPTEWHKKILMQTVDDKPIFVWHEGVDHMFYVPAPDVRGPLAQPGFTFVNVGKWERRKGQAVLLDAFSQVAKDHVGSGTPLRLLATWYNPWLGFPKWLKEVERACSNARFTSLEPQNGTYGPKYVCRHLQNPDATVEIHMELPNREAVQELYYAANAGVFPHFAEGWGLSIMEMMAMGKPIAATSWGAPLEYLDGSRFFRIWGGQKAQAYDALFFHGDKGNWYQVDPSQVALIMNNMLTMDAEELRSVGLAQSEHVRENFSWLKSTEKVLDDLVMAGVIE
jgi:glycosyltransferase involved in cell wall biosynthesis